MVETRLTRPAAIVFGVGGTLLETVGSPHHRALSASPETAMIDADTFARAVDLVASECREAGGHPAGERKASRSRTFKPADVKAVRADLGQSQTELALMIGVSVATLRNWEQGRRVPDGPALALLQVAAHNPAAVIEALHRPRRRGAA